MNNFNDLLKNTDLFIFDCDGTLVDSMPMWNRLDFDFAEAKGIRLPEDITEKMNSLSLSEGAEYYVNVLGVKGTPESVAKELADFAAEKYRFDIGEKPGAAEFLRFLKAEERLIALATASEITSLSPCLERLGMLKLIDYAVSCDDVGKNKNFPDVYLNCAEHFGLPAERCAVVEDSLHAALTAKKAGFSVIGIYEGSYPDADMEKLREISDVFTEDFSRLI